LPDLDRAYIDPGTVLFAFRHLPIERIHGNALNAAVAADCAGDQGQFWAMHDRLFENPKELSERYLASKALLVGLEPKAFAACVNDRKSAPAIREEVERAASYGITVTPAFLFGELRPDRTVRVLQRAKGALPFAQFRLVVDRLLRDR
jgi:protein-disulfide isomerase